MNILAPSILSADFKRTGEQLREIAEAGAEYVHVDVMDGMFVPSISFGMPVIKSLRSATDKVFDVHLMIEEPIRYLKEFKDVGADIITIHYEACEDVRATLEGIRELGLKSGLSVKPKTDVNVVREFLDVCDMILLMSVEPGFGGQKFIDGSLERAAALRQIIEESGRDIDLEIDGGVNLDNVSDILDAGVNVIVAGSAVFKDPAENTRKFMEILNSKQEV
ncbi:MAG: ribulose-phosphate 3-epimerase [Lachnospiraceae bacterium]|nr:ribulose-phosphate 3-epimerase [Lachnospiraceae bacterium]MBR3004459.1 ribulose-phosphate 3-epimerase [Lachnospiraceae bacterium]